jgi:hypothetical protein
MSNLGIKNVLPYKGANGIVVNNNVISINPNAAIVMQEGRITFETFIDDNHLRTQLTSEGVEILIQRLDENEFVFRFFGDNIYLTETGVAVRFSADKEKLYYNLLRNLNTGFEISFNNKQDLIVPYIVNKQISISGGTEGSIAFKEI